MRLENIGLILAAILASSQVLAFTPSSQFISTGLSSPSTPAMSPEVREIRADVALAGQQKKKRKKGKKKKKDKEPIAAPYTVAQGTRTANLEDATTVLQTVAESKGEEPVIQVAEVAVEAPEIETVSAATTVKVESDAERAAREAQAKASKARQESISRALLEARLDIESKERATATAEISIAAAQVSRARQERISRALLQARLNIESKKRARAAAEAAKVAAKAAMARQESISRGLLQARINLESKERARASAKAAMARQESISRALLQARIVIENRERARVAAMKAKQRTEAAALGLMQKRFEYEAVERLEARKRKQVETNMALFATRLVVEANSKRYKAKVAAELSQRALLVDRLEREERIREEIRIREEALAKRKAEILEARKQPKAPEVEKMLQETYAAIDDLGERAFTMLVKLGIVEPNPDPEDPNYDDSYDHEYVYDFGY